MSHGNNLLFVESLFNSTDATRFPYTLPVGDWSPCRTGVISANIPVRSTHEEVLMGYGGRGLEISQRCIVHWLAQVEMVVGEL